jgi:hypothetical protein
LLAAGRIAGTRAARRIADLTEEVRG